ncbi:hypothetical protein [Streptomyces sp. NPDC001165]|uniref:hypothetical protein n=1 Tax=Streptomyces sp. NPDC001165 TaxID=3364546 RepID=UPI0036BDBB51
MGRQGGPGPGVRFLTVWLALPALLWTTSCGGADDAGPGAGGAGGPGHSASGSAGASAAPASDAELCARIVAHGSRKVLDSGTYGDYQSMGLSNAQYEILRDVVDAARAAERRQGAAAADELIDRQARSACAERYRHGTPSGGPWQ